MTMPWSAGQYTYATNGHIMVRVPRLEDAPERKDAPKGLGKKTLDEAINVTPKKFFPIPSVSPKYQECPDCGGTGMVKPYGKKIKCDECNGEGKYPLHASIEIGGVNFSDVYLSWIAELPGAEIGPLGPEDPARFRFTGGDGLLMPRRS